MNKISRLSLRSQFEIAIAVFLVFTPLLLRLADPICEFRDSISAYVRMENSHYFGIYLTIAAMLFLINGFTFFTKNDIKGEYLYNKHGRWYNVILGFSLLGVVFVPYDIKGWCVLHFIFATIFFIGSAVAIVIFTSNRHRKWGWLMLGIILFVLLLHFGPKYGIIFSKGKEILSLFFAEWIGMVVIAINYILEAKKIIAYT
ncbi:DUF7103 family protein [Aquimarina algiphila]|uniref:DUF7103 family protein n=1 Tax=Aquimarina algiphila TaxID=2047982 RepID=UPI002492C625|nr:DUF998 domain-containing protein [Aquimarina algiphila]